MPIPAEAPELRPPPGLDVDDGVAVFVAPAPAAVVVAEFEAAGPEVVAADEAAEEVDDEAMVEESNRSRSNTTVWPWEASGFDWHASNITDMTTKFSC